MAQPAVAADFDQPLDIHIDFATQIAFDQVVAVDIVAQSGHFRFIQIFDTTVFVDFSRSQNSLAGRLADPIDIGQRDDDPFVAWDINTRNTCHNRYSPSSCSRLALTLFVFEIFTNHVQHTTSAHKFTVLTNFFDRWPNFHALPLTRVSVFDRILSNAVDLSKLGLPTRIVSDEHTA